MEFTTCRAETTGTSDFHGRMLKMMLGPIFGCKMALGSCSHQSWVRDGTSSLFKLVISAEMSTGLVSPTLNSRGIVVQISSVRVKKIVQSMMLQIKAHLIISWSFCPLLLISMCLSYFLLAKNMLFFGVCALEIPPPGDEVLNYHIASGSVLFLHWEILVWSEQMNRIFPDNLKSRYCEIHPLTGKD